MPYISISYPSLKSLKRGFWGVRIAPQQVFGCLRVFEKKYVYIYIRIEIYLSMSIFSKHLFQPQSVEETCLLNNKGKELSAIGEVNSVQVLFYLVPL